MFQTDFDLPRALDTGYIRDATLEVVSKRYYLFLPLWKLLPTNYGLFSITLICLSSNLTQIVILVTEIIKLIYDTPKRHALC